MGALGWTKATFKLASELKPAEQSKALCDNKIDAFVYTVGHPSGSIKEATTSCDSIIVNVDGPAVDELVEMLWAYGIRPYITRCKPPVL